MDGNQLLHFKLGHSHYSLTAWQLICLFLFCVRVAAILVHDGGGGGGGGGSALSMHGNKTLCSQYNVAKFLPSLRYLAAIAGLSK